MTTKDENKTKLGRDLQRVVADLKVAIDNNNPDEISAKLGDLDALAEAASAENTQ